jgi:glycosyltransferase involved in cell wall biosynthesis
MKHPGSPIEVSVVIPCRDCARYLARQLDALAQQDYEGSWEVIVVDNGSTDGSRVVAESFRGPLNLRVVNAPDRTGAAYARNVGARASSGGKLLFVDADDEVAPGYLTALSDALDTSDFVASRVDSQSLNPDWIRAAHAPWQDVGIADWFGFLPCTSVNIGVSRSMFEAVGGWPEEYPASEDIAFAWRLQLGGASLHFVPEAIYRCRYRDSLAGLYRQTRRWGVSSSLLYREFKAAGMRRRPLAAAVREWLEILAALPKARSKAELAPLVVRLGDCLGRLKGGVRYRVLFP